MTNAALRDATGLDTLAASMELRELRDRGLLELQGAGSATYYILGERARALAAPVPATSAMSPDRGELTADRGELPADLRQLVNALGARPRKRKLRDVILRLCALGFWGPAELAKALHLGNPEKLVERHLAPMCGEGSLVRLHPDKPQHPEQAYRTLERGAGAVGKALDPNK